MKGARKDPDAAVIIIDLLCASDTMVLEIIGEWCRNSFPETGK